MSAFKDFNVKISVLDSFNASYKKTREWIAETERRQDNLAVRETVERRKKNVETLLNGDFYDGAFQAGALGTIAAIDSWIENDERIQAECEGRYAYHCQQHPDEVPAEDAAYYAGWVH